MKTLIKSGCHYYTCTLIEPTQLCKPLAKRNRSSYDKMDDLPDDPYPDGDWNHYNNNTFLDSTTLTNSALTAQVAIFCFLFFIGVPGMD